MIRAFLAVQAILFAGFGVYVFAAMPSLLDLLGVQRIAGHGLFEIRSNYGGINLGIGLFCLAALVRPSLERHALVFVAVFTGSYAVGRLMALPYDGNPTASLLVFGCYEAAMSLIALWLLRRTSTQLPA